MNWEMVDWFSSAANHKPFPFIPLHLCHLCSKLSGVGIEDLDEFLELGDILELAVD